MKFRALALGTVIGFVVAFAPSCGGSKCGASNCNGCCDSSGKCVAQPNNANNTTCGSAGLACDDCTKVAGQVCNATTHTCGVPGMGGGTGGGTGGGMGGGGGGGGGGGSTCPGCTLPGGQCAPGTSTNNCGSNGAACMACPVGQLCTNQMCQTPQVTMKIGDPCATNADCASLGVGAICKTMTSSGNATYVGGYCTFRCTQFGNDPVCGTGAFCVGLNPRYGEDDTFCWDRCMSSGDPCRTPGYACYNLGSGFTGCWLNPLPAQDAGPPADKIGEPCTMDTQCQNPPDNGGFCTTRDDSLGLVFPGGYCSKDFCADNAECGADGGGICIGFGDNDPRCMRRCSMGGTSADAGQSDCRPGYLCLSYTILLPDGGRQTSSDGYCRPPPPPPPTTVGQACTTNANCEMPANTIADCFPETFTLSDGGTGQTGFPGGYCTRFNCSDDSDCGPMGAGLCLRITSDPMASIQTACFQACASGGQGQSTCRNTSYVCQTYGLADGGTSVDGYCDPRCDAPGNRCPSGRTCNRTTGYCQ